MRYAHRCIALCCVLLPLMGCQSQTPYNTGKPATNWNPFAGWGQSRVPPPGTNQYGTSTLAPTQGYSVPPGTPFAPIPPGATAPPGASPFNGARGGAVTPGPSGYAQPQANASPANNDSSSPQVGSLGPATSSEIRRASFEDPATQHPREAVRPASGESSNTGPAPAAKISPY